MYLPGIAVWRIIPIFRRTVDGCWWLKWIIVVIFNLAELFRLKGTATPVPLVLRVVRALQAVGRLTGNGSTLLPRPTIFISGASIFRMENLSRLLLVRLP